MWALSSFRRLSFSSSSLLSSHGVLKFISYMPSRYAAFTPGGLKNDNGASPGNVASGGNERIMSDGFKNNNGTSPGNFASGGNEYMSNRQTNSHGGGNVTRRTSNPIPFISDALSKDKFQYRGMENKADIVHIKLKRNNSFVTVTDSKGNTKLWATSGLKEVAGGGKLSRYSAEATAEYAGRQAKRMGLKSVVVKVNGFTFFKKKRQAIMSFREGFTNSRIDQNPIVYIEDTTRRPHNGCRLPKRRRT